MEAGIFIRLNTAFRPPAEIVEVAIKLSQELARQAEPIFILDGKRFHPHITIYSPEYPEARLDKILETVSEVSQKTISPRFMFKGIIQNQGFIGIEFDYLPEIRFIHERIVAKLNPLREGHIRQKYLSDYNMNFSDEKVENIEKYGYPNSMSLYHPHLTLIRLADEGLAENFVKEIDWPIKTFKAENIAIFTMGENGTCRKLIKEFPLVRSQRK